MSLLDRLRAAIDGFRYYEENEEPFHRHGIVIGDSCYLADTVRIDSYSGLPEWDYRGNDGVIHCKAFGDWILKTYEAEI